MARPARLSRPLLSQMWTAYQPVAPETDGTYEGNAKDLEKIGNIVGGAVKRNMDLGAAEIRAHHGYLTNPTGFTNGCATRMSYTLNNSGIAVPKVDGQTVTGADHKNYIYRVAIMTKYVRTVFGSPDISVGPAGTQSDFLNKKGMIAFEVNWSDATGHVTLWDGHRAVDEDYFSAENRNNRDLLGVSLWLCP